MWKWALRVRERLCGGGEKVVTGGWEELWQCSSGGTKGECVWMELARGVEKVECVLVLKGVRSAVRLF